MKAWNWLTGQDESCEALESLDGDLDAPWHDGRETGFMKRLAVGLLKALRKDHRALRAGQKDVTRGQADVAESLDGLADQMTGLREAIQTRLEQTLGRLEQSQNQMAEQMQEEVDRLREQIQQVHEAQARHQGETTELVETLAARQVEIDRRLERVTELMEKAGRPPDSDLLKAIGGMIQDDDRVLVKTAELIQQCPKNCFAEEFAREVSRRLAGVRAERVSLLAANDIEIIKDAQKFDPSLHQATGRVPRSDGETGQGRVERIGLLYRGDGEEKVMQRALVSVFDDVEAVDP